MYLKKGHSELIRAAFFVTRQVPDFLRSIGGSADPVPRPPLPDPGGRSQIHHPHPPMLRNPVPGTRPPTIMPPRNPIQFVRWPPDPTPRTSLLESEFRTVGTRTPAVGIRERGEVHQYLNKLTQVFTAFWMAAVINRYGLEWCGDVNGAIEAQLGN